MKKLTFYSGAALILAGIFLADKQVQLYQETETIIEFCDPQTNELLAEMPVEWNNNIPPAEIGNISINEEGQMNVKCSSKINCVPILDENRNKIIEQLEQFPGKNSFNYLYGEKTKFDPMICVFISVAIVNGLFMMGTAINDDVERFVEGYHSKKKKKF